MIGSQTPLAAGNRDLDVIVVGAGISGINTGYRLSSMVPDERFVVLESRASFGGTWDLFNYPGIRSDSDFWTFGFAWWPWAGQTNLATKQVILDYMEEAITNKNFGDKFRFGHKVLAAEWSSIEQRWTVQVHVDSDDIVIQMTSRWLIFGTGYYDYKEPRAAAISGLENFKGRVIHPQFWPAKEKEIVGWQGKKVAVIGSGATAITILPAMAEEAEKVTMIQRSPTYIFPLSNSLDPMAKFFRRFFSPLVAVTLLRWRLMIFTKLFAFMMRFQYKFIHSYVIGEIKKRLPEGYPMDPNFMPTYRLLDQRPCMAPDGDMFEYMCKGKIHIETGIIKTCTENAVILEDDRRVEADLIIPATGLKLHFGGDIDIRVDGEPYAIAGKHLWKGFMFENLPNSGLIFGYLNASFTLGADASAHLLVRMIRVMRRRGVAVAIPRVPAFPPFKESRPLIDLKSTYVKDGLVAQPLTGSHGPWIPRSSYFYDMGTNKYGNVTQDIEFIAPARDNGTLSKRD